MAKPTIVHIVDNEDWPTHSLCGVYLSTMIEYDKVEDIRKHPIREFEVLCGNCKRTKFFSMECLRVQP